MTKNEKTKRSILTGPTYGYTDNFPKREMWDEIVKELNGEFKIKESPGNILEIHNITIPYKKWTINISISDSRPLKFEISFDASQEFDLVLSWEDFIDRITKKFGKPEIEVGWKEFDNHYLIKSDRSDLVKQILTGDIQKTLLKYNVYSISYTTDPVKRTAELVSVIQRAAGDKAMILELVEAYKKLTDNLEKARIIR
jgi:hypothetical protein